MTLASTLARAARSEQRLWRSTCIITKPGAGQPRLDLVTLHLATPPSDVIYAGSCQLRPMMLDRDHEQQFGQEATAVGIYVVKVPLDVAATRGDTVVVDGSSDPAEIGRVLIVKEVPGGDWLPVRRLVCEEVSP